ANASGLPAGNIVSWNGSAWAAMDSGLDRPADALAVGEGALFVGGEFATAGGNGAHRFASWALTPTAVASTPPPARAAMLEPAVPNPFNPSTQIRYRVAQDSRVTIGIYDVAGRRVRLLVDEFVPASANVHSREWDGTADNGARAASGVFFVRMQAGGATETQKIVLLK
ncbi:MAG: T9SS type A sorting domain-containing protein, partial [Candidatus Krumholzibacteria bacterium]|nr:T9SS type A sorting domain-containing protein [Candidatus Krumholzibacteria bacterium]